MAATGNDGSSVATFPAGDRGVVGVTSTDSSDALASGANFGQAAFLAAPGVDIATTGAGGGLATISGTSAAAASVAGAAALLRANEPQLSNGVVVSRLARTADPAGDPAQTGNGRLNLARAIGDASLDELQPSGATPVGSGGPVVGPYIAAGNSTASGTVRSTAAGNPPISGATITATCTGGCGETATSGLTGAYAFAGGNRINYPGNGPITITPTASAPGFTSASLTFTATNQSDHPNLNFLLSPANTAPTCTDPQSGSTNEDTPLNGNLVCTDADGNPLTYSRVTNATNGNAVVNANGSFTYTPNANFNGSDSFTFKANDGTVDSNTATFNITVNAVNDAPTCTDPQSGSTNEDTPLNGNLVCTDADGNPLTYSRVTNATNGNAVVNANGSFTYTPNANFNGSDSFTFKANDGTVDSNTATFNITVNAVNEADLHRSAERIDERGHPEREPRLH